MEKLIIEACDATLTRLRCAILSDQGGLRKLFPDVDLPAVADFAHDKEIIVIAPPEAVLLIEARLPKLSRSKLREALPYAVEEQVLADVDDLHFALGEYQANGTLPVAIVAKARLAAWLSTLKNAGIEPAVLLPAPLCLPYDAKDWFIRLVGDSTLVRTSQYSGFACDRQNLPSLLQFKQTEQSEAHAVYLINTEGSPFQAEKAGLPANVREKQLTDKQYYTDILPDLEKPAINLLQGEFQARRKNTQQRNSWRLAGYVAATWLALVLLGNGISYLLLHHEASQLQTAINAIYKRHFPHATSVVAPKQRITDKLNNLLNQNHKNRILVWLASLGKSLHDHHAIQIRQLDFHHAVLTLEITAPSFDSIDQFTQALTQQNLHVRQQNIAAAGAEVKGALVITDGGRT